MKFISFVQKHSVLFIILIMALSLRLGFMGSFMMRSAPEHEHKVFTMGDARQYTKYANLINREGITGFLQDEKDVGSVTGMLYTSFRTPVYPLFLAALFTLFGNSAAVPFVAQSLLDMGTIILIYILTMHISRRKWGALLAAALYAFSPLTVMYTLSMYAESLFTFCLMLTLVFSVYAFKHPSTKTYMYLGLLIGITTLVKPVMLYFVPVVLLSFCFDREGILGKENLLKKGKYAVAMLLIFFVVLAPWQMRNYYLHQRYSVTFQQGRELLVWRVGTCQAWTQKRPKDVVLKEVQAPFADITDPFEQSEAEGKVAMEYIKNHPREMLYCHGRGLASLFFVDGIFNNRPGSTIATNTVLDHSGLSKKTQNIFSKAYLVLLCIQYIFGLIALICLIVSKKQRVIGVFALLTLGYFTTLISVDGYSRYLYALTPLIAVLASLGVMYCISYIQSLQSPKDHTSSKK